MKRYYLIATMVAVVVVLMLCIWLMARPVSTKIVIMSGAGDKLNTTPEIQITNNYYSTVIPAGFKLYVGQQDNATNILDRRSYFDATDSSRQLAITVGRLEKNDIRYIADYNFRISNPHLYAKYTFTNLPLEAQAFINTTNNFEISVFWPYKESYAAIVVSGLSGNTATLEAALNSAIAQWQWH